MTATGYGDIADVLSFRAAWMHVIDRGELAGHVIFAQDDSGNHYACSASDEQIYFVSRRSPEYALVGTSLGDFLVELEHRRFDLEGWTNELELKPYHWEQASFRYGPVAAFHATNRKVEKQPLNEVRESPWQRQLPQRRPDGAG